MIRTPLKSYRRCSFCGCRGTCLVQGVPCHWVGPKLCSNPGCIERARMALRRAEGPVEKSAKPARRPARPARYVTKDGREIHRSPWAWLIQRKKAWDRDGGQCQRCGEAVELRDAQVHHVIGRGMGGGRRDDAIENLETLCLACHMREHGQGLALAGEEGWGACA